MEKHSNQFELTFVNLLTLFRRSLADCTHSTSRVKREFSIKSLDKRY